MVRFNELFKTEDHAKWISQKLNNGEFDYWLVVDTKYLPAWMGEGEARRLGKHVVTISVVAPSEAGDEHLAAAVEFRGWIEQGRSIKELSDEEKVELLDEYGTRAVVWESIGNNLRKLLREAKEEAQKVEGLFGFYMDRAQNRMGNTGWDFIKGDIGFGGGQ